MMYRMPYHDFLCFGCGPTAQKHTWDNQPGPPCASPDQQLCFVIFFLFILFQAAIETFFKTWYDLLAMFQWNNYLSTYPDIGKCLPRLLIRIELFVKCCKKPQQWQWFRVLLFVISSSFLYVGVCGLHLFFNWTHSFAKMKKRRKKLKRSLILQLTKTELHHF